MGGVQKLERSRRTCHGYSQLAAGASEHAAGQVLKLCMEVQKCCSSIGCLAANSQLSWPNRQQTNSPVPVWGFLAMDPVTLHRNPPRTLRQSQVLLQLLQRESKHVP